MRNTLNIKKKKKNSIMLLVYTFRVNKIICDVSC